MPIDVAKAKGAIAMFGEKYGAEVRVVDYLGISMELCGGTHVDNTAEIGVFKIVGETGIAAGIRRIEAVAGAAVLDYLQVRELVVRELGDRFKAKPEELPQRVSNLQAELKAAQKQLETLKQEMAILQSDQLLQQVESIDGLSILIAQMGDTDAESLKAAATRLLQKLGQGAVVLASIPEPDKINFVAALSPELNQKGLQAGKLVGEIAKLCGGGGGGRPNLAQAGGKNVSKLPEALALAKERLIG
jgi:alanyl-tRNA synthetase